MGSKSIPRQKMERFESFSRYLPTETKFRGKFSELSRTKKKFRGKFFFEMSHKIVRMSRHFFASKHKQPRNELISCDFIKKLRFSKARRIAYFRQVFLSLEFVLNGGGKSHKVSLNQNQSQSYKVKVFATVK